MKTPQAVKESLTPQSSDKPAGSGVDDRRLVGGVCCPVWPLLLHRFSWFRDEDGNRMMPHYPEPGGMWRVNHCPSCGADVRSFILTANA